MTATYTCLAPLGCTLTKNSGGTGTPQNPYLFKGGIQDRGSGLVKFGLRWYDPITGRWTQQDTLDTPLDPANANRYGYAGDDPINGNDPTGRGYGCGAEIAAGAAVAVLAVSEIVDIGASVAAIPVTGGASVLVGADLAFVELAAGVSYATYGATQC